MTLPPHDPETGEIIEQDAPRPSNRDVSAGGEPCPADPPQGNRPAKVANAEHAAPAPDQGEPAGHEGHPREGAGAVAPVPARAPGADPIDLAVPAFLRKQRVAAE